VRDNRRREGIEDESDREDRGRARAGVVPLDEQPRHAGGDQNEAGAACRTPPLYLEARGDDRIAGDQFDGR
jgi:hypothetical protein